MPFVDRDRAFEVFRRHGMNSSHFVWFLTELRYFEATNGWLFACAELGGVLVLPLEPLIPGAPASYGEGEREGFAHAWRELKAELKPAVSVFVSVYTPFLRLLEPGGFQSMQVGQEPWVRLDDCRPKGNAAKGVRSARNQALKAGLRVELLEGSRLEGDQAARTELSEVAEEWAGRRLLRLDGFLNTVNPFQKMGIRRYLLARSAAGRLEGYLVVTPVPGSGSYFLEDLVLREGALRGTGELLTVEALSWLGDTGGKEASLGVVSITGADLYRSQGVPKTVLFLLHRLPALLKPLYNFEGLQTFRKRFKPHRWEGIHLAVRNEPDSGLSDTRAWLWALLSIVRLFKPRLRFGARWLSSALTRPWRLYPVTLSVVAIDWTVFALVNRFGDLPRAALDRFGFFGNAPVHEWVVRSLVSDHLYFNSSHFLIWGTALFAVMFWAEATHRRRFILGTVCLVSLLDDFINYLVVIHPLQFFQPTIFEKLVRYKDVGGSLLLVTLFGLQMCEIRRHREIIFAGLVVVLVFGFAFSSGQYSVLVLNLNHFLFFCLGYVLGKLNFQYEQRKNRKASRARPIAPTDHHAVPVSQSR